MVLYKDETGIWTWGAWEYKSDICEHNLEWCFSKLISIFIGVIFKFGLNIFRNWGINNRGWQCKLTSKNCIFFFFWLNIITNIKYNRPTLKKKKKKGEILHGGGKRRKESQKTTWGQRVFYFREDECYLHSLFN